MTRAEYLERLAYRVLPDDERIALYAQRMSEYRENRTRERAKEKR